MRRLLAALFICLSCLAPAASAQDQAQDLPRPRSDTLSDLAGLLTPDQTAALTASLQKARDETGVQIVAATLDRLPPGARIEDYAKALFDAWGIGDPVRNDGIMLLAVRGDRTVRVALGAGYDPVWDGAAQRVIDTAMLPAFAKGDFAQGMQEGVAALVDRVARPHAAGQPAPTAPQPPVANWLIPAAMVAGFAALVLAARRRRRTQGATKAATTAAARTCPSCGHLGLRPGAGPMAALTCPACGWVDPSDNRSRRDPMDRRGPAAPGGRGGDGEGFGGGRSDGGGASGRW